MNTKVLLASGTILAVLAGGAAVQASAAEVSATTSHNLVTFIAGDDSTGPVDPTDPTHPVDPEEPVDPEDPENPGTGNKGPLSLDYVTNFKFGTHKISGQNQSYAAKNVKSYIQLSDTRGTSAGWTLKATPGEFKSAAGDVLKGATVSLGKGNMITAGDAKAPEAVATTLTAGESSTVIKAAKGTGEGTWVDQLFDKSVTRDDAPKEDLGANEVVKLNVVGGTAKATSYTSDVKWSLEDTPMDDAPEA